MYFVANKHFGSKYPLSVFGDKVDFSLENAMH